MSLTLWLAFVAASSLLLIVPGPTILTVVGYSISHGRRATPALIAGVALGDSTALVVSLVGLGSLLAASSFWFTVVKTAGGLYLLWLGIKSLRAQRSVEDDDATPSSKPPASRWRLFRNTWLVTALNPKGIVFFVAFLPQFIDPRQSDTRSLAILAVTFVVLATINATLYAIFAGSARRLLSTPRARRVFHITGGSLLSIAGLWALTAHRP